MNECGVVNTDCYDPGNRRIEEKSTNALVLLLLTFGSPGQQACKCSGRGGFTCRQDGRGHVLKW